MTYADRISALVRQHPDHPASVELLRIAAEMRVASLPGAWWRPEFQHDPLLYAAHRAKMPVSEVIAAMLGQRETVSKALHDTMSTQVVRLQLPDGRMMINETAEKLAAEIRAKHKEPAPPKPAKGQRWQVGSGTIVTLKDRIVPSDEREYPWWTTEEDEIDAYEVMGTLPNMTFIDHGEVNPAEGSGSLM